MPVPLETAYPVTHPAMSVGDAPMPCHTETFNGMKVLELSAGRLGATSAG